MQSCLVDILEEAPVEARDLYQQYSLDEEINRIAYHYEVEPEFFRIVTGGEWNNYSCSMWEEGFTLTQAQEKKLDEFARMMGLKKGMRILDVGCGWGGPLVYLCKKYGVEGHGITISPMAIPIAEERAKKHNVNATFEVVHWKNLRAQEQFDCVYSDEVVVHFNDLGGFFKKAHQLLKPGGMMVNKELHFRHSKHKHAMDKLSQHINKVYAYTGNYRTLSDELKLVDSNDFQLEEVLDIPISDYKKTISNCWLKQLNDNRSKLERMTNKKHVQDFKLYLKGICRIFSADVFGLHIVASRKA
ncbi:SAM-dependent methyltransferase [Marinagarivorans cellulosilyticus]|uniref:Cyclopropane-fatty-acyl-phospholipid synthase n=1 Tax=Marinagarivorans cellulosilyticus TaxID=2721545 RepID=A0AAN1WG37_9GAMM|nr:class I SAM-dependent methyltransferase [Marinagarivorans cellulosilyticus]BCD96971.1 cyclopropane-fatty-acyl-phospholipid synthase [Marinagarivorans cellulosilyticus]